MGYLGDPCLKEAYSVVDWLANYGLTKSSFDRFYISLNDPSTSLYCSLYYEMIGSTLLCLI